MKLEGVIPAPLTPFNEKGKVDFDVLQKQISYLIQSGVNGLFVGGTTGEGPYLDRTEKLEIFKAVKEVADGRVFLCAACLQPSTPQVLQELEEMQKLEPEYVVAVSPYYYAMPQEAIVRHFQELARRSAAPVIIYNIPERTHNSVTLETVLELAHTENIAGIKDSSGDFVFFCRGLLASVPPHFAWIMGDDYLDCPAFMMGAHGIVTGLSNVWAQFHVELYRAAKANDRDGMMRNHALIHRLHGIHTVTGGKVIPPLKAGAACFGRCTRRMKTEALTLTEQEAGKVRQILEDMHLL